MPVPPVGVGLPERPCDSELSLRKGRVGADPVKAVLDLPGARGLFTLVVGQSAAAEGVVPFEHESLLCLSVLWGLAVQRPYRHLLGSRISGRGVCCALPFPFGAAFRPAVQHR